MSSGENVAAWDRFALAYQDLYQWPVDVVSYGPGLGTEKDYRLLGNLASKRVLDLGCGGGQNAIAMARQGAVAVGVDASYQMLAYARRLLEAETDVRVELRHGDLAELAFLRADSVDLAFSAWALQYVEDLPRVFRQVHRVCKPGASFVFVIPHPSLSMVQPAGATPLPERHAPGEGSQIRRSYFDTTPMEDKWEGVTFVEHHRTLSDIFMHLSRAGFRVDVLLEPETEVRDNLFGPAVPGALVVRGRKES